MTKTLVILSMVLFAGCTTDTSRPVLRIASDATFAPFHFPDEAGGATGFDIELARAVASGAGFEPLVVVLPYDELFSGLLAKMHDVVAATTGITPERERIYLFGEPYIETCQVAVVRAGPGEPETLADLRGAPVGAAGAGTSMKALQTIAGNRIRLGDGEGVSSLEAGIVDAWIVGEFDGVTAARASQGRLRVLSEAVALERYAFVLAADRGGPEGKA